MDTAPLLTRREMVRSAMPFAAWPSLGSLAAVKVPAQAA